MVKSASGPSAPPELSVVRGTVAPTLLVVEIESAAWRPAPREERLLAALDIAGLRLACALPSPYSKQKTSACTDESERRKDEGRRPEASDPAGTSALDIAHPAASRLLSRTIILNSRPSPEAQLIELCQTLCIAPPQIALIASTPKSQPIALKVGLLLALKGAGYENEAAADRVFVSRNAGGLERALEYVVRLARAGSGASPGASAGNAHENGV